MTIAWSLWTLLKDHMVSAASPRFRLEVLCETHPCACAGVTHLEQVPKDMSCSCYGGHEPRKGSEEDESKARQIPGMELSSPASLGQKHFSVWPLIPLSPQLHSKFRAIGPVYSFVLLKRSLEAYGQRSGQIWRGRKWSL